MLETITRCLGGRVCSFDDRRPSAPVQLLVWLRPRSSIPWFIETDDKILQLLAGTLKDHASAESAKNASIVLQTDIATLSRHSEDPRRQTIGTDGRRSNLL
jgi:hypothetical protein